MNLCEYLLDGSFIKLETRDYPFFSFQIYSCFHKFTETFAYAFPWSRCLRKFQAWKLKANIKYLEIIYSNILRDEEGTS